MNYADSPTEADFRAKLRAWLASQDLECFAAGQSQLSWYRTLADAGYVGLSLPAEYGGRGLPDMFEAILNEELAAAAAPPSPPIGHLAHALLDFAREELRRRYLPGMLSCRDVWCQGFSEPGAGSDIASLTTRAEPIGPAQAPTGYRITGQKIWTSGALWSRFCLLFARTEAGSHRHHGLSMLVVPMQTPGVQARAIPMSTGSREFAEVFFDGAQVPAANLVGKPGQGWQIAMQMLAYERGPADMGWVGRLGREISAVEERVRTGRLDADEPERRRIAAAWVDQQVLQAHVRRSLAARVDGPPGAGGSVDKLLATRVEQSLHRLLVDLDGGAPLSGDTAGFERYLYSRAQSIYGGTQQIQRTIVAQRILGLPRPGSS
jgi:alkylation response protein AidB-like acyl-CoA dehydrogenase